MKDIFLTLVESYKEDRKEFIQGITFMILWSVLTYFILWFLFLPLHMICDNDFV